MHQDDDFQLVVVGLKRASKGITSLAPQDLILLAAVVPCVEGVYPYPVQRRPVIGVEFNRFPIGLD